MDPTTDRLDLAVDGDGALGGSPPRAVVRTHSAELWFHDDLVVKHKLPVDLGFLDFSTLERRRQACIDELRLNRRMAPDVYLGLVDVVAPDGAVIDVGVVMRRLPEERRLSTLAQAGNEDLHPVMRDLARQIAVFHAGAAAPTDPTAAAGADAVRRNWQDNLAVLREYPHLAPPELVQEVDAHVSRYLAGREDLFADRVQRGLVRDGHGDLQSGDVFVMADGARILDCLDFAEHFRVGDVLLDVAFLMMDLERLGRGDLGETFLRAYEQFSAEHHPSSLAHHFIAYRAGVRAKVTALASDSRASATGEDVESLLSLALRHLDRGRCRLVLVGGLPGTGKSTVASGLSAATGMLWLRSDEIRKELFDTAHDQPAPPQAYEAEATSRTYDRMLARAGDLLRRGESVVLDATWTDPTWRRAAATVAEQTSSDLVALRCALPRALAHDRLRNRHGDVSDADERVHDLMHEPPWPEARTLATDRPVADVLATATDHVLPQRRGVVTMSENPTDNEGLEVLDFDECLYLLSQTPVGRVAFVSGGEPMILPVNHVRDGRAVAFRVAAGSMYDAAAMRHAVAFEVDDYDPETRTGWSVLLRGSADLVDDPATRERLEAMDLHPWADGTDRPTWVRISPTTVTGRRIADA